MPVVLKSSMRTEKLIEAATKLFARQGYHRTSTRQIAHLAGVGENTLFRQFNHKEELFWSALRYHSSGVTLCRDLMERLVQCDAPEVVLPKILDLLTEIASYKPELLRLITVAYLELHWKADAFGNECLSPVLAQINQYLEFSIKHGKIRRVDSTVLTTALMITTLAHPGISRLIHRNHPVYQNAPEAGLAYAKFWLDLLAPELPVLPAERSTTSVDCGI
jgi:AcrR family transcriptional regulator